MKGPLVSVTPQPTSTSTGSPPSGEYLPWDNQEFLLNPYPRFARVQEETPVYLDPSGAYVVMRYDDIVEFGRHPAMSVEPGWDQAGAWAMARDTIIGRDTPDHTRLRRQTNRWFAPKLVREWVSTTAEATAEVLDEFEGEIVDGFHQLAAIPTHRTMCRVLQVPEHSVDPVKEAMARSMPMLRVRPMPGDHEKADASFDYIGSRVDGFLEAERAEPSEGLINALLSASDRGEISSTEMRATIVMFYGLGHMDIGYTIASGLHAFAQLPEVYEAFRTQVDARDDIVNEIIRMNPAGWTFYRTNTEPVTIRGFEIPANSKIRFMIGAANRDSNVFENPHVFDFTRPPEHSRNLSFGVGTHTCAGQALARAEARTIFEVLAARYRAIELAGEVVMLNTDFSRHFKQLPLRLIP